MIKELQNFDKINRIVGACEYIKKYQYKWLHLDVLSANIVKLDCLHFSYVFKNLIFSIFWFLMAIWKFYFCEKFLSRIF